VFATLVASPTFAAFLIASVILAVVPGPGVLFVVTRTLHQGRIAGFASVCGIAVGNFGNAAAAAVGLATLLAASATAFTVVKLAGAGYLVFLGIKALRTQPHAANAAGPTRASTACVFRDGAVVALFNPKTALFFAALLPQFVLPSMSALGQSLVLGTVFVLIALCTDTAYVLFASAMSNRINKESGRRLGRYVSGATFVGLGIYSALATPRAAK
jgi:threonine/homoserine/homoserine lactone efflux protein